jgi:hypothetical protein
MRLPGDLAGLERNLLAAQRECLLDRIQRDSSGKRRKQKTLIVR